jgi:hypothetical protein
MCISNASPCNKIIKKQQHSHKLLEFAKCPQTRGTRHVPTHAFLPNAGRVMERLKEQEQRRRAWANSFLFYFGCL